MCTDSEKLKMLVSAVQNEEPGAFETLYAESVDLAYGVVSLYLTVPEDTEDVLQNVFLRVHKGIGGLHSPDHYKSWLTQITKNECIRSIEKSSRVRDAQERLIEEAERTEWNAEIVSMLGKKQDLLLEVRSAVESLPKKNREIIVLFYFHQMSVSEIASYLGVSEGTVKSRMHYGRKKLQKRLDPVVQKDDVLYGISVFPLVAAFLHYAVQNAAVPTAIKTAVWTQVAAPAAAAAVTAAPAAAGVSASAAAAGSAAVSTTAGAGTAAAASVSVAAKIAAVAVAASVAVGTGTAVKKAVADRQPQAVLQTAEIAVTESGTWTQKLSEVFIPTQTEPDSETVPESVGTTDPPQTDPPQTTVTVQAGASVRQTAQTQPTSASASAAVPHTFAGAAAVTTAKPVPTTKAASTTQTTTLPAETSAPTTQTTAASITTAPALQKQPPQTAAPTTTASSGTYSAAGGVLNGYIGTETALVLPQSVQGESVTAVGAGTFRGNSTVQSVSVPGSISAIGQMAFADCRNLQSVRLSEGLQSIELGAFSGCTALGSASLPSTVTKIGDEAFADCTGLRTLTIPAGVTDIGEDAFDGCDALVIRCPQGSAAHAYAEKNGLTYQLI